MIYYCKWYVFHCLIVNYEFAVFDDEFFSNRQYLKIFCCKFILFKALDFNGSVRLHTALHIPKVYPTQ